MVRKPIQIRIRLLLLDEVSDAEVIRLAGAGVEALGDDAGRVSASVWVLVESCSPDTVLHSACVLGRGGRSPAIEAGGEVAVAYDRLVFAVISGAGFGSFDDEDSGSQCLM